MTGERVEVIDPNFRVLETVPRPVAIKDGLRFKLALVIVRNSKNQFFIHQRKASKETFPLKWALGAGGAVRLKESFKEAANREAKEELGVKAKLDYLFDFDYKSKNSHYKAKVFLGTYNGTINLNKVECEQGKWVTVKELTTFIKKGHLCPDTALFAKKFIHLRQGSSSNPKTLRKRKHSAKPNNPRKGLTSFTIMRPKRCKR